jgi:hypothetical protein
MPVASSLQAWTVSRWPKPLARDMSGSAARVSRSNETRRHQEAAAEEVSQEFGHFLVEGEHLLLELQKAAQHNPALLHSELYVSPAYQHWVSPFRTELISERSLRRSLTPKAPRAFWRWCHFSVPVHGCRSCPGSACIYLHEVQDPGNLGTILRTLAWFGGFRCLLSPGSVDPFNPKVVRASMGAIFHVPLELDLMNWARALRRLPAWTCRASRCIRPLSRQRIATFSATRRAACPASN